MFYYSYPMFLADTKELLNKIDFKPDAIVGIARGGLTMAHFMSLAYDIRQTYAINAMSYFDKQQTADIKISNIPNLGDSKKVLIVDEIIDSGKSMNKILEVLREINPDVEFKTAVIYYKTSAAYQPDYFIRQATEWIEFFWEADLKK